MLLRLRTGVSVQSICQNEYVREGLRYGIILWGDYMIENNLCWTNSSRSFVFCLLWWTSCAEFAEFAE